MVPCCGASTGYSSQKNPIALQASWGSTKLQYKILKTVRQTS